MKLRDRLLGFSAAQLAVFGALFAIGYIELRRQVIPILYDHVETETATTVQSLASHLDVPLAAADPKLVAEQLDYLSHVPSFAFVEVRDARGAVVFAAGPVEPAAGPPLIPWQIDDTFRAWAEVRLEGVHLGTVAIAFDTDRADAVDAWFTGLAIAIAIVWLVALAYSVAFSRAFVSPIRHMMAFSRKVASGELAERLAIDADGELHELADHLNAMTADLEARENERRAAAERADALRREIVTMSRVAGMAEVATGVLHNVGNVLNSVNVSVSVVGEHLRSSKVMSLGKAVEMFESHPGGLGAFLATDRGKLLPNYLSAVTKHLLEENSQVQRELASVVGNVDHIKTIVMTQQRYAQPSGVDEVLDVAALVEDALKIGESSFARHGIELVRDIAPELPHIVSDRHKVLQILINLISNARHALKMSDGMLRLTVRAQRTEAGITIEVIDTGVGIAAENLLRIFQHGFTTKKDGHGFGLHSSANAAREIGGTLVGTSDGPGRGATFRLELPLRRPRSDDRN
jgi:signal transduction histidine kinase